MLKIIKKWIRTIASMIMFIAIMLGMSALLNTLLQDQIILANPDDDTVDGEFRSEGYNNPVSLTKFLLEDRTEVGQINEVVDESTSPVSITTEVAVARPIESYEYLIPQQEYTIEFDIHDRDTFQDVESVEVRLFYNVSGSGLTNGAVVASTDATPETGTGAVIKWQRGVHSNAFFVHNTSSAVSWDVLASTAPAVNVTSESVTFEFTFKFSKVSTQSNDLEWHIGFNIIDSLTATGITESNLFSSVGMSDTDPANATPASFNMAFYGEVELPSGQSLDWGALKPGSDFAENKANTGDITFISNGPFESQIAATSLWQATNASIDVADAVLVTDPAVATTTSPQAFGMRWNDLNGTHELSSGSPTAQTLESAFQRLTDYGVKTNESGVNEAYSIFLAISKDFQNATYTGDVIFLVNNKVADPITNPDQGGQ